MTDFNDRQKAFEKKFEHDEEMKFKVVSRAAKILGLWAAERMGITGDAAATYAASVLEADLALPGHNDLLDKVEADFKAKGVDMPRRHLVAEYDAALAKARAKVMEE